MIDDIRKTHERLEGMKSTQSTKIVNEVKSDAHKHRGRLLEEIARLEGVISKQDELIDSLRADLSHFWGESQESSPAINSADGPHPESG